jgi:hypothetical protein
MIVIFPIRLNCECDFVFEGHEIKYNNTHTQTHTRTHVQTHTNERTHVRMYAHRNTQQTTHFFITVVKVRF